MGIRIILADSCGILSEGIQALINERHCDVNVVGQAYDGLAAIEMTRQLRPDVVVMGVDMSSLDGVEVTRQIKREQPEVKVLALSSHAERKYVLEMIKAGVSGYMPKECLFDDLVAALRVVAAGQSYLSPQIASIVLDSIKKDSISDIPVHGTLQILTQRDKQILQLLTQGKSAKQIASELKLSIKTIEAERRHTMQKLEVDNLVDLTKYAIREGLTTA